MINNEDFLTVHKFCMFMHSSLPSHSGLSDGRALLAGDVCSHAIAVLLLSAGINKQEIKRIRHQKEVSLL